MNKHDAKFLLRARRPGGRDANDPMFAEALAEAARDPGLKAWQEREERFDAAMTAKLGEVAVPAGLREAILAGGRASGRRTAWWRRPEWLAAAAAVAVLLAVAATMVSRRGGAGLPLEHLAEAALRDLATAHDEHVGRPAGLGSVQARMADLRGPMSKNLSLDLEELRRNRCRAVTIGGVEVFEICFQRDGAWFHLYATRSGGARAVTFGEAAPGGGERLAVAAWSDARHSYALVTDAGRKALERVL